MKISELETFVVANANPREIGGRYFVFLKLRTDDGIEGLGEVYATTFLPKTQVQMIEEVFEHQVLGADPFQIERLWRDIYSRGYSGRPEITLLGVLSGIEIALWDIIGKAVNKPIYALLGGMVRQRLRTYTYLYVEEGDRSNVYADPDLGAKRAAEYLNLGFTALKFDALWPYSSIDPREPTIELLDHGEAYVRKVREAVGSRCDLLIGTHGQLTTSGAIRFAKRVEQYSPLWFEEPVPPEMPEEMAKVARATSIPVASGERLTTKYEYARLLESGAASILQPSLGRVGGILEAKKIAGMAEAHYATIAPHLYCGPVVGAANIQLATCSPNFLILESIMRWDGFYAELLKTPIHWQDGYVIPPSGPGLGIELNEEVARRHPYIGTTLHQNPIYGPVD
jgi:2-dehydro-3-deoxyphosphogalactonate aldolase